MNNYICSECNIQLSDWEMQLNRQFPIGKLYCEYCQTVKERAIIKQLAEDEADMTDDYVRQCTHQEFTEDLIASPSLLGQRDNNEEDLDEVS